MNRVSLTKLSDLKGIAKKPQFRSRADQGKESENQKYRIRTAYQITPAKDLLASVHREVELNGEAAVPCS